MSAFIDSLKRLKKKGTLTNEAVDKLNCLNPDEKAEIKAVEPEPTESEYKQAYEILSGKKAVE